MIFLDFKNYRFSFQEQKDLGHFGTKDLNEQSMLKGITRRLLLIATGIVIPLVVIAALVGIYYPKAPEVNATKATINNMSYNGLTSVSVDMDVEVEITNKNTGYPISFQPVDIIFYFPASPDEAVGKGVLQGGTIEAGQKVTRQLHAVFDAPLTTVGANFLRDMNQGSSSLDLKGEVLAYTSFIRTDWIVATEMNCEYKYNWNSGDTSHDCHYKPKVRQGSKESR